MKVQSKAKRSRLQKFFLALVPQSWAELMEAESRRWISACSHCNKTSSIWDAGGIRWKAKGNPRRLVRCVHCERKFVGQFELQPR